MDFKVRDIVGATGGTLLAGHAAALAGSVASDTRTLESGQTFVALHGKRFDGHDFLCDAARKASCLVVDDVAAVGGLDVEADGPAVVLVQDTLEALGDLAEFARRRLTCPVVAVTGSCGKTTLKEMIGRILAPRRKGRIPPASFNNQVGVPLTLLAAEPDDAFVLCELGTNAAGEIAHLARIARPTIGVVTVVGPAHLEGLGSIEGVAEEKAALVASLPADGVAVLNADDSRVAAMAARSRARVVTFGIERPADLRATDLIQTDGGIRFTAGEGVDFTLPVLGEHHALLALAAAAVARELGVPLAEAAEALRQFRTPPMRLALERIGGLVLLNDAYNANPQSMRAALGLLALWPGRRKVFFCGDMLELGDWSAAAHADLGREAVEAGVARLVCVGQEVRATAEAAREAGLSDEAVTLLEDAEGAAALASGIVRETDVVLIKGSRAIQMERVADAVAVTMRKCARREAQPL